MKVFIDTEFYEHGDMSNATQTVRMISIGLVRSDGEKLYMENSNFDWNIVPRDHWLQENVRPNLIGGENLCHPANIRKGIEDFVGPIPKFYGWYCDYDWVVLMSLWGAMVNQPSHFPKFCVDLRQMCDEARVDRSKKPKQIGQAHNALDDAIWNKTLYEWIGNNRK